MFVTFIAIRLVPGDPVEVRPASTASSPERLAEFRHQLGLDQPALAAIPRLCRGRLAAGRSRHLARHQAEGAGPIPAAVSRDGRAVFCAHDLRDRLGIPVGVIAAVQARLGVRLRADGHVPHRLLHADLLVGLLLILFFSVRSAGRRSRAASISSTITSSRSPASC